MGRPPCCDKAEVKKGPWTPEEDIVLVSYIQQNGAGNWRTVPDNTGLLRCSKSCRLRWTNYLRPGIKRGNFTDHEETMIIHLQALLGNRWAAMASYLPQRTDNDIKNYWNTHLKKKLRRISDSEKPIPRGQWEQRLQTDIHMAKQALSDALSINKPNPSLDHTHESSSSSDQTENPSNPTNPTKATKATNSSTYASSTENIARLLQNWAPNKNSATSDFQCSEGFGSMDCTNSMAGLLQDDNRGLVLLEKWMFDEAAAAAAESVEGKGEGFGGISLDGNVHDLF